MAISITQRPTTIQRVGGRQMYVATSTNVANAGFKYLVTIDVDGNEVYKGYHDPNPSGRLVFDARKVMQSIVKTDTRTHTGNIIHRPAGFFARYVNGIKAYTINIGEVYVSGGVLTEFPDLATSTREVTQGWYDGREEATANGYNTTAFSSNGLGFVNYYPFLTSRIHNYVDKDFATSAFAQDSLNIVNAETSILESTRLAPVIDVTTADDGVLVMSNYVDTFSLQPATHVRFTFYNGDTQLNTYLYELNATNGTRAIDATEVDGRYAIIGAYPNNVLAGFMILLNPTWTSYIVQPVRVSGEDEGNAGQYVRFRKTTRPCRNDMRRIAWANRFGGYDYFWFEGATEHKLDSERKTYRKVRGDYGGTAVTYTRYDGERENYYNDVQRMYRILHGGVTTEERIMLESLFTAQHVWIYENNNWLPCNITDSNYTRMSKQSKYFTVSFNVNLAYDANA